MPAVAAVSRPRGPSRSSSVKTIAEKTMSPRSERQKQRYAEDPEYRARILASNLRYATAHKEEIAEMARVKWVTDPEFRAKGLAASRARDSRADNLKQAYGLSLQDYDAMLRAQN